MARQQAAHRCRTRRPDRCSPAWRSSCRRRNPAPCALVDRRERRQSARDHDSCGLQSCACQSSAAPSAPGMLFEGRHRARDLIGLARDGQMTRGAACDSALQVQHVFPHVKPPERSDQMVQHVAIVGAGMAGLAAARVAAPRRRSHARCSTRAVALAAEWRRAASATCNSTMARNISRRRARAFARSSRNGARGVRRAMVRRRLCRRAGHDRARPRACAGLRHRRGMRSEGAAPRRPPAGRFIAADGAVDAPAQWPLQRGHAGAARAADRAHPRSAGVVVSAIADVRVCAVLGA